MASSEDKPLVTFGIITDIQYADIPNGTNFKKNKIRYYRNSINVLKNAIDHWKFSTYSVDFVLQLGDIIDGQNNQTPGTSDKSLEKVLGIFAELNCPKYHAVGNHELYNFNRGVLNKTVLNSCSNTDVISAGVVSRTYYHFSPVKGFRVVVLDTFDISLLGHDKTSLDYQDTLTLFRRYNKNEEPHDPSGLPPNRCMYAAYNGGVSDNQLKWLDDVLSEADDRQERVIVAGHVPIYPGSAVIQCLCWNYESILSTIQRHHKSVLAYIAGHDHSGGYAKDDLGISYITFPGVIDTPPDSSCFATAHVYEHKVIIQGFGDVPTYALP